MNSRMDKFCHEYVIDLNAKQAAIRSGYSEKTAYSHGSRLLNNVEVKAKIRELQSDMQKASSITALRVLMEHKKIAFSSISHLHNNWIELKDFESLTAEQKACIKSISSKVVRKNIGTKEDPNVVNVEFVKIELYDKQKALDSISNLLGFNAPKEISQHVDFNQLTDDQIDLIINKLTD